MQQRPTDDALYRSEYRDRWRDLTLPPTYRPWVEQYAKLPRPVYNGVQLVGYDYVRSPQALKEQMIRTFQTITGVDRFVGALRAQLQDLGLAENTLIVFSTDHGLHWGEHGLGGKALLYEEDLSIPLIIADPRQGARGQVRDELVAVPDLAPTVLELCGLEPSRMQGRSLAPLLRGEHPAWRDAVLVENLFDKQNYPRCEGIRAERWKYLRYFQRTEDPAQAGRAFRGTLDVYADSCRSLHRQEPVHEELFDLQNDPHESTNLIAAGHDEVLCDLRGRLVELAQALCDDRDPSDIIPIAPRGGGG